MGKFASLPTWLLVRLLIPFLPRTHPWYGRRFALQDWYDHARPFTRWSDMILWFYLIVFCWVGTDLWIIPQLTR